MRRRLSFDNEAEMSSQTHLYGVCARAALFFAAFVAVSTILACSSVYLAAAAPSSPTSQDTATQVKSLHWRFFALFCFGGKSSPCPVLHSIATCCILGWVAEHFWGDSRNSCHQYFVIYGTSRSIIKIKVLEAICSILR